MSAIYEPRGAAREYAPLACNLYRGCGHGCLYCYAPACLRMDRAAFGRPQPRPEILHALARDAAKLPAGSGPVLLCFTCDPYQPLEAEARLTREALSILREAHVPVRLLTKNPALAMRDLDPMVRYRVEFGVSLVWSDDALRRQWEPAAGSVAERLAALAEARRAGLSTWVSMEPVIEPDEALAVLGVIAGTVDVVKIGKLNHDAARERLVDWPAFTRRAIEICRAACQSFYLKNDLWQACRGEVPGGQEWPMQRREARDR